MTTVPAWTRLAVVAGATLLCVGCAQVACYVPDPTPPGVRLEHWNRATPSVETRDLRADQEETAGLMRALRSGVEGALQESASGSPRFTLQLLLTEHRAFFTLGNWNARTQFQALLVNSGGTTAKSWKIVGTASRSNMMGYSTARAVSNDAFHSALSDLLGQLDTEDPTKLSR